MEHASRMSRLFGGYEAAYGTYDPLKTRKNTSKNKVEIKDSAETVRRPVTLDLWRSHLDGRAPLGIIPIRGDDSCIWGCVDVDQYDVDHAALVREIMRLGLPLVVCKTKSGGAHIFMFLMDPQPAADVQLKLKMIAAALGFGTSEIFPKQTHVLVDRGDLGNWLNMPYFMGDQARAYAVNEEGRGLSVAQFLKLAEDALLTDEGFQSLTAPGAPKKREPKEDLDEGPPCLQILCSSGFPEGTRNNGLFALGVFCKKKFPGKWQTVLESLNQKHMSPPLPSEEVAEVIRALEKKEYNYRCNDSPLVSHCNAALCRTRKYGVGGGGEYPLIAGMSVLESDPPIWFLDVDGERVALDTEQLMEYRKFQRMCVDALHVVYRPMKQETWLAMIGALMESVIKIEAPSEVGVSGEFEEHLEDFCLDRHRAHDRAEVQDGKPWEDEERGRFYFRLRDLMVHLRREKFDRYNRGQVTTKLRDLGGDRDHFILGGHGVSVFWVPSRIFHKKEPSPLPPGRREPV